MQTAFHISWHGSGTDRKHRDGGRALVGFEAPYHLQAADAWKIYIEQDEVWTMVKRQPLTFFTGRGWDQFGRLKTPHDALHQVKVHRVVFDV